MSTYVIVIAATEGGLSAMTPPEATILRNTIRAFSALESSAEHPAFAGVGAINAGKSGWIALARFED